MAVCAESSLKCLVIHDTFEKTYRFRADEDCTWWSTFLTREFVPLRLLYELTFVLIRFECCHTLRRLAASVLLSSATVAFQMIRHPPGCDIAATFL